MFETIKNLGKINKVFKIINEHKDDINRIFNMFNSLRDRVTNLFTEIKTLKEELAALKEAKAE